MMKISATACIALSMLLAGPAVAQRGQWNAYGDPTAIRAPLQSVESERRAVSRDPTGILRGQGISSRHGGIGNMGGGSGRSANTGVGLGGIGANQGARF